MKKILIVEDQRMPRENMERMIAESGRYESAGSISDAGLALARCCRIPVDLILMDVCTAGNRDGIEAAAEIKAEYQNHYCNINGRSRIFGQGKSGRCGQFLVQGYKS